MAAAGPIPVALPTGSRLRSASIEQLFATAGALREGHFRLKSGRHSARYLEKFTVLQYPSLGVEICRRLAAALADADPTVVVGPTTGGVLLAFETARQLEPMVDHTIRALFAEPVAEGGRALRRGWELDSDDRVVLVDDILTTGESLRETIEAVRAAGAEARAAAVIVDRSTAPLELGVPLTALGRIEIPSSPAESCELCATGDEPVAPGSSR